MATREDTVKAFCPYCGVKQTLTFDRTDKTQMLKAKCVSCASTWLMAV